MEKEADEIVTPSNSAAASPHTTPSGSAPAASTSTSIVASAASGSAAFKKAALAALGNVATLATAVAAAGVPGYLATRIKLSSEWMKFNPRVTGACIGVCTLLVGIDDLAQVSVGSLILKVNASALIGALTAPEPLDSAPSALLTGSEPGCTLVFVMLRADHAALQLLAGIDLNDERLRAAISERLSAAVGEPVEVLQLGVEGPALHAHELPGGLEALLERAQARHAPRAPAPRAASHSAAHPLPTQKKRPVTCTLPRWRLQ